MEALAVIASLKLTADRALLSLLSTLSSLLSSLHTRTRAASSALLALLFTSRSVVLQKCLTDEQLEAELRARRARRAEEREKYAKSMRTDKLKLLEGQLSEIKKEIARIDLDFSTISPAPEAAVLGKIEGVPRIEEVTSECPGDEPLKPGIGAVQNIAESLFGVHAKGVHGVWEESATPGSRVSETGESGYQGEDTGEELFELHAKAAWGEQQDEGGENNSEHDEDSGKE